MIMRSTAAICQLLLLSLVIPSETDSGCVIIKLTTSINSQAILHHVVEISIYLFIVRLPNGNKELRGLSRLQEASEKGS